MAPQCSAARIHGLAAILPSKARSTPPPFPIVEPRVDRDCYGRCGVDLDEPAYRGTGALVAIVRDRAFIASGLAGFADGWFGLGALDWTSGANAGRRAEVLMHEKAEGIVMLTLLEAPVRTLAEGNGFIIRAGCDKRIETCRAKFGNVANFRGFPSIPGQDAVIRYATQDGGHKGGIVRVADPDLVVAVARRWLGTPYHDQASVPGVGCDCLGLARGVWREVVGPELFRSPGTGARPRQSRSWRKARGWR